MHAIRWSFRFTVDFAEWQLWNVHAGVLVLLGPDARRLDHFGQLFGVIRDKLPEGGRRARKHGAAQLGDPRVDFRISETNTDFLIEPVDDFGGCVLGRANPLPTACFITRQEVRSVGMFGK